MKNISHNIMELKLASSLNDVKTPYMRWEFLVRTGLSDHSNPMFTKQRTIAFPQFDQCHMRIRQRFDKNIIFP